MSSEDELREHIKRLEEKLQVAVESKALLESKKPTTLFSRDRKFPILSSDLDVDEWCCTMEKHLNGRFSMEDEKVLFIIEHLDKRAKAEVKFRFTLSKASSAEVLLALKELYQPAESLIRMQEKFYGRVQLEGESLEDFAVSLMELLGKMSEKQALSDKDKTEMIKSKFADSVSDLMLKRELIRLNEERPSLSFLQLRQHAVQWNNTAGESAVARSEGIKFSEMVLLLEKQQKQIDGLTDALKQLKSSDTPRKYGLKSKYIHTDDKQESGNVQSGNNCSGASSDPDEKQSKRSIVCHYCKKTGHYKSQCYKLKNRGLNYKSPAV